MKYFAYGSNLLQEWLCSPDRVPSAQFLSVGYVTGRQLSFHKHSRKDGSGKCDIPETGNSSDIVLGALYDVPDDELPALDRAEGAGYGYERRPIQVFCDGDSPITADVYLALPTHIDSRLAPFTWYRDLVLSGARQRGFPDSYIAAITAVAATTDPDIARSAPALQALQRFNDNSTGSA